MFSIFQVCERNRHKFKLLFYNRLLEVALQSTFQKKT